LEIKKPYQVPLRESLTRPRTIAGVQRELFISVIAISAYPAIPPAPWFNYVIAGIVFTTGMALSVILTKRDPFIINTIAQRAKRGKYYGPWRDTVAPMPASKWMKKNKKRR